MPPREGPLRAILYERVSSAEQKRGYSLHAQHHELKEYCRRHGYRIVRAFREVGKRRDMSRPALMRLLELADEGVYDVVVVWRRDRFGAGRDVSDVEQFLRSRGVRVETTMVGPQPDTSSVRLVNWFLDGVADHEIDTTQERCSSGKLQAAREGKWPLKPPGGWTRKYPEKAIVVDEPAAAEIRGLFEAVVAGKTVREISGDDYTTASILYRLHNPAYKGETSYCGIPVRLPPIVSPDLWDKAQRALESRKRNGKRGAVPTRDGSPPPVPASPLKVQPGTSPKA